MFVEYSFDESFKKLFKKLDRLPHSYELRELDGIGRQLDLNEFSKKFFSKKGETVADISVDANANVDSVTIAHYNREISKPLGRMYGYYLLWKYAKQLYNEEIAEEIIVKQFCKSVYINDFHNFGGLPYSYHEDTILHLKIDNNEKLYTIKQLFDKYSINIQKLEDREIIKPIDGFFYYKKSDFFIEKHKILIKDDNKWVSLLQILRHKKDNKLIKFENKNGKTTIVTENHPIILENNIIKEAKNVFVGDKIKDIKESVHLSNNVILDNEFAYLIGFWLGDGYYTKWQYIICQKEIEISNVYSIAKKYFENVNLINERKFSFGSKFLYSDHKFLEMGEYCHSKHLPENILEWSKEAFFALLCGIIDSDGRINKATGVIDISVTSFALVQQIATILRGCDYWIRTSFISNRNKKREGSYETKQDMFRVSFSLNIKDKNLFYLSEKIKKYKDVVYRNRKTNYYPLSNKIIKIEEFKTFVQYGEKAKFVYDITTETGTFNSQGLHQHNCFAFSLLDLMQQGIQFGNKIKAEPAKHLSSFMGHIIAFLTYSCQQLSGACAIPDALIIISFFIDKLFKENQNISKDYLISQVRQELQGMIYQFNQPFRGALESAFTNISIYDDFFLDKICNEYLFPDGTRPNKNIIKFLQNMFLDLMNETLSKTPITFPIITACFSVNENKEIQDEEFLNFIVDKNYDFGFINIFSGATSITASCCRLRNDSKNDYFNTFGSGGNKLGSLSVTTLNLPRIAYETQNVDKFLEELKHNVELTSRINNIKRHMLENNIENGYLPLYTLGFMSLNKQYSTCGINGLYESLEILGYDVLTEKGQELINKILDIINQVNLKQEKKFNAPHNAEIVPAESSGIKLAEADRILGYNNKYFFYSNQFIPLTHEADMYDRIKLQGMFDSKLTGGAILHINFADKIKDKEYIKKLIKHTVKSGVIYHAINYLLNRCVNNHITVGKSDKCYVCKEKIEESYERIVGFLVPVNQWNKVRRTEDHPNRIRYET